MNAFPVVNQLDRTVAHRFALREASMISRFDHVGKVADDNPDVAKKAFNYSPGR